MASAQSVVINILCIILIKWWSQKVFFYIKMLLFIMNAKRCLFSSVPWMKCPWFGVWEPQIRKRRLDGTIIIKPPKTLLILKVAPPMGFEVYCVLNEPQYKQGCLASHANNLINMHRMFRIFGLSQMVILFSYLLYNLFIIIKPGQVRWLLASYRAATSWKKSLNLEFSMICRITAGS